MSIINYHFKERSQYPSRRECCGQPCAVRQPPPILPLKGGFVFRGGVSG